MEKPIEKNDALSMLVYLNGSVHQVITGLCICDTSTGHILSRAISTNIHFKNMSQSEPSSYVEKEDVLGIAGAYDHENLGCVLLEKIDGDYYNSIGVPLSVIADELKKFGINVL